MLQVEALASMPTLTCVEEDLDADRQGLTRLAQWSQQFSPLVGLEEGIAPTCLLIDTTGCAACFGGEEKMIQRTCEAFSSNGWTVIVALADTIGAARGISQFSRQVGSELAVRGTCGASFFVLIPRDGTQRCLVDLPVAALRLTERNLALLKQLGIERIHQLAALPRDQVADRFGTEISMRLDQAMGQAAEVIAPFHDLPEAVAGWTFDDPVERREILAKVLGLLLERLQSILEKRCCGTRLVECTLEQEGGDSQVFECSLSRPARAAAYLRPLLDMRLEQLRVQEPIVAICLRALVLERMPEEQRELFDLECAGNQEALAHFLDSLVSRLGRDTVTKARIVADPQPERTCRFECALESGSGATGAEEIPVLRHRPLRIFPRPLPVQVTALVPLGMPQRFHYAGTDYLAIRCQGPERIETGWWRSADIRRDYYIVETTEGTRWWLFRRRGDGHWFLHGCFD
jgi:protein ImuB